MANLINMISKKTFYEHINWEIITNIMQTYAPGSLKICPIAK